MGKAILMLCFVAELCVVLNYGQGFEGDFDASEITWAHAVNKREKLEQALNGKVNFLEADVSLGIVKHGWERIPIMAHPPIVESDISLEDWMEEVIAKSNNSKGVKLDFKSTGIVSPSLKILEKWKDNITFPLWLNADILPGPINASATAVDNATFFRECSTRFPAATLSVGWTTDLYASPRAHDLRYSWNDVWNMVRAIRCAEVPRSTNFTFPVRGALIEMSIPQLVWLVETLPNSTLTVWSSVFDPFNVDALLSLRQALPISRVYYDLPALQRELFVRKKVNVSYEYPIEDSNKWGVLRDSEEPFGCDDETHVTGSTILYGGRRTVAVFLDRAMSLPIKVTARLHPYELSDYDGNYSGREGVVAVVASSKKSFWTEGLWVNDTRSTLFAVGVGDPDHTASCCSAEISIHYGMWDEDPVNDLRVDSCYSHDTCKLYTDRGDVNATAYRDGFIYVGFVFQGNRAFVLRDVSIEGNETVTGGAEISKSSSVEMVMALTGWTFLTAFGNFGLNPK